MPARFAVLALLAAQATTSPASPRAEDVAAAARRVHDEAIVLDTHVDVTPRLLEKGWSFFERHQPPARGGGGRPPGAAPGRPRGNHVDYPRMKEGGLDGFFFSIYMSGTRTGPPAVARSLVLIDAVRRLVQEHPEKMALATTTAEVRAAARAGKAVALMGMEGGHMIDDDLAVLRTYAALGVRYLTLTHSVNTNWADSSGDTPRHGGLSDFGREVVRELNRQGVMVDVSHVSDETFWDALETSRAPLLASHSSCRALSGHPRNMTDEMIKAMAARGGVIQINYLDAYLDHGLYLAQEERQKKLRPLRDELERRYPGPENEEKRYLELRAAQEALGPLPRPSWEKIVEHIDHAVKAAGWEHVGLGSDFDGAPMPQGMEDCTRLPKITEALLRKGYTERQIKGVLGENLLGLMEKVEQVARGLQGPGRSPGP